MDVIDVEVIRCSLANLLEEAEVNICETAFSPIVYEVRDFCTALLTPDGEFIAQGIGGVPIFLGDLDAPVRDLIDRRGSEMRPGDAYLTNESAVCGQHLNNVVALRPVYWENDLQAVAAVRVHWLDIGGRAAGGWVSDTTSVYQEGLQIPCLLAERDGKAESGINDLIAANVRFPDMVLGDMRAQLAATSLLENRYRDLLRRYGPAGLRAAIDRIWSDSEALTAAAIQSWQAGPATMTAHLDEVGGERPQISTTVRYQDGRVEIDFAGTSAEMATPLNSGYGAAVAARIAFKMLTVPDRPADQGAFRRLDLRIPDGTFLSCGGSAPVAQWSAPLPTAVDVVLAAMGELAPGHLTAAHHGELGGFALFGKDPQTNRDFYQIDTITGGWGGTPHTPGRSALKSICHGDTYTTPVELEERSIPIRIRNYRLRHGSGGDGVNRGGLGTERTYEITTPTYLNLGLVRAELAPWGVEGGQPGASSDALLERPGEAPETLTRGTNIELPVGSTLTIRAGGGGGHGPPGASP
jgi:N-methylhydantoinase B